MDPQATINQILNEMASSEPDRDLIATLLIGLAEWIDKGGFMPEVERFDDMGLGYTTENVFTVLPKIETGE